MAFTALFDANVLYPTQIRDLLGFAQRGLFRAKWTERIHDEWIGSIIRNRLDLKPESFTRAREAMYRAVADSPEIAVRKMPTLSCDICRLHVEADHCVIGSYRPQAPHPAQRRLCKKRISSGVDAFGFVHD